MSELPSIERSSNKAATRRDDEAIKDEAGCGSSHGLCAMPKPIIIQFAKNGGADLPAVMALRKEIPEQYKNDERVKQSIAWFTRLEVSKVEKQVELAKIRMEIDNGTAPVGSETLKKKLSKSIFESWKGTRRRR